MRRPCTEGESEKVAFESKHTADDYHDVAIAPWHRDVFNNSLVNEVESSHQSTISHDVHCSC